MSNTTYFCIAVILTFIVLSFIKKDNSYFEIEDIPALIEFNQELDRPTSEITLDSYSDPEIIEMKNLLEKDSRELKERVNMQAWSVLVDSYSTKEDVMKDFVLLNKKGYKAYIRDSTKGGEVIYTLNVGPNMNEETAGLIRKEIQALLNVSPKVQYYQD